MHLREIGVTRSDENYVPEISNVFTLTLCEMAIRLKDQAKKIWQFCIFVVNLVVENPGNL